MPVPTWPSGTSASDYHGPWRASSTPSGVSYYYNGSTGSWLSYNSSTGATSVPTNTSTLNTTFGSLVSSASAATGPAVTASATAATTAASLSTAASAGTTTPYYPEDLATTKQDRIKFEMFEPSPERSLTASSGFGGGFSTLSSRTSGTSLGSVFLGIQGQLSDSNAVDWSGMTINPLQLNMAAEGIIAMGKGGEGDNDLVKDFAGAAGKLAGQIALKLKTELAKNNRQIQILLAQEAVQSQGLLSRLTGQVANPNLELLFNGPTLRPFSFNFRMAPRSSTEAANVKKIIRFFKKGMAVRPGETFLKSPNIFGIQFLAGDSTEHTSLPRIKTCALIGCDVNYTPDGSYMTFADSANGYPMTCYEMTLRFSELEPIYANNYDDTPENSIGY
jgi:hypothetical protein